MKSLEKNQPLLLAYLVARGEEFLRDDEVGDLVFLGAVVWRCFDEAYGNQIKPLTLERLEKVEKGVFTMMEESESNQEEAATELALKASQQPLLQTILSYLMEGGTEIHPDRQGIAFFLIKIVVDSLDSKNGPPPGVLDVGVTPN